MSNWGLPTSTKLACSNKLQFDINCWHLQDNLSSQASIHYKQKLEALNGRFQIIVPTFFESRNKPFFFASQCPAGQGLSEPSNYSEKCISTGGVNPARLSMRKRQRKETKGLPWSVMSVPSLKGSTRLQTSLTADLDENPHSGPIVP